LVNTWQKIFYALLNAGIGIWSQFNDSIIHKSGVINLPITNFDFRLGEPILDTLSSFEDAPIFGAIIVGKVAINNELVICVMSFNILKSAGSKNKQVKNPSALCQTFESFNSDLISSSSRSIKFENL
jgi:hypothetical protein